MSCPENCLLTNIKINVQCWTYLCTIHSWPTLKISSATLCRVLLLFIDLTNGQKHHPTNHKHMHTCMTTHLHLIMRFMILVCVWSLQLFLVIINCGSRNQILHKWNTHIKVKLTDNSRVSPVREKKKTLDTDECVLLYWTWIINLFCIIWMSERSTLAVEHLNRKPMAMFFWTNSCNVSTNQRTERKQNSGDWKLCQLYNVLHLYSTCWVRSAEMKSLIWGWQMCAAILKF